MIYDLAYPLLGCLLFCRSLSIPLPKEETLSKHSILGPNGLRGQWQPPSSNKGVWCFSSNALFDYSENNAGFHFMNVGPLSKDCRLGTS